jgi:hypothetical protein
MSISQNLPRAKRKYYVYYHVTSNTLPSIPPSSDKHLDIYYLFEFENNVSQSKWSLVILIIPLSSAKTPAAKA